MPRIRSLGHWDGMRKCDNWACAPGCSTSAQGSRERIIPKDGGAKHLEELISECEEPRLETVITFREREGKMKQRLFLKRRSPCLSSRVARCATTKILKSSPCEAPHVNIIADAVAFTRAGRTSFAEYAGRMRRFGRMRRPRREELLRQSRLRPSLRVDPMELALPTILLGQVPR